MFAMAKVYKISNLELIIREQILNKLCRKTVLQFCRPFTTFVIDSKLFNEFPGLENAFEEMIDSCLMFADFISSNFSTFSRQELYENIPICLLAQVLRNINILDAEKADFIDSAIKYCHRIPSQKDCEQLRSAINWNDLDCYLLFLRSDLNWASPSFARTSLSRIIDNRRQTLGAFERAPIKVYCVNWYAISWITSISEGKGNDISPRCEITDLLGRIGVLSTQFSPVSYRLLEIICSPALQVKDSRRMLFGEEGIAEESENYYLSGLEVAGFPFIGYKLHDDCFIPDCILFVAKKGKPLPGRVIVKGFDVNGEKVYESEGAKFVTDKEVALEINVECRVAVCAVTVEMVEKNAVGMMVLRCSRLKVFGRFCAA
jgi:hypothetical protein